MPISRALPDVIADVWPTFGFLRTSSFIARVRFSTVVTMALIAACCYYTYQCFSVCNFRKFVFILCISLLFRSLCIISTQLPPACNGFPKCKCVMKTWNDVRKNNSIWRMAGVYTLTFGLGTKDVPACGDLMMSGHSILQCCMASYLFDIADIVMSEPKRRAMTYSVCAAVTFSMVYAIIIRSEYTVSTTLSLLFVRLVYKMYNIAETMHMLSFGPFLTTLTGRGFAWLNAEYDLAEEAEIEEKDPPKDSP